MLPSDHKQLVSILKECGFVNVRKCYKLKVSRKQCNLLFYHDDYLQLDDKNDKFKIAAEMVFNYYKLTHENIVNVSFFEENEIAYVASNDYETFEGVISSVIHHLFSIYNKIEFEADSTYDVAQLMLGLVNAVFPVSFDIWLYKK